VYEDGEEVGVAVIRWYLASTGATYDRG
jgi:hypothetical protein